MTGSLFKQGNGAFEVVPAFSWPCSQFSSFEAKKTLGSKALYFPILFRRLLCRCPRMLTGPGQPPELRSTCLIGVEELGGRIVLG